MSDKPHECTMRDRIQRIEDRTGKLETSTAVMAEHLRNIDANVKAMKEAWIWTSRAVIGVCLTGIGGIVFGIFKAGLHLN